MSKCNCSYIEVLVFRDLLLNKRMKVKRLAEKYDVSVRTIYRVVERLNLCAIPVNTIRGRYGGLELDEDYIASIKGKSKTSRKHIENYEVGR